MAARGDLISVTDPVIGVVKQQGPAVRFVGEQNKTPSGAPKLGEHTRQVLAELAGVGESELDRLQQAGII
jgi:crotonobetainyl-CoA:carnitine CoA-transferase CaiB-like acyl-CoA transferase